MAIEILEGLGATQQPLDRFLKQWFRSRRFAGSADRRAIGETVFAIQRSRARLAHRMGCESARAMVVALAAEQGGDMTALFSGGYGPAPLSEAERAASARTPDALPDWVRGEYPPWLEDELKRAFGERLMAEMAAMQARAPVDLRVNTLKASRPDVLAALKADGFAVEPTPWSPVGIRIPREHRAGAERRSPGDQNKFEGSAALAKSALFAGGAFEFQDEAAQIASLLAGARPGMAVLDLAAGAGGKALAMAAAMQDRGRILAFDDRPERLAPLAERAARAGADVIAMAARRDGWDKDLFDLVFLDAPCSGTGTWRRQPELRWRLTPERLADLTRIQDRLLDEAARHTRPGGMILYATCSVLPVENQDRIAAFLARQPRFVRVNLMENWQAVPPPGLAGDFRASPARTGTDGFFAAGLGRS
jgi:16S rRNA (cytosine967-C5)-methyltransferase